MREWKTRKARELRQLFELDDAEGPLFSIVSRLVHQKGIDLSIEAAELIVANGGQLVVTGQGEPALERAVEKLAKRIPARWRRASASTTPRRARCSRAAISC